MNKIIEEVKIYLHQWSTVAELLESRLMAQVMFEPENWDFHEVGKDGNGQFIVFRKIK